MADTHYTEWFRFRSSALAEDAFHVIRFSGTEGLNRLFSFTIELASLNADIDAEAMLAASAEFAILREGAPDAVFRGFPARVDQGGHFGDYTFYTVELRPAFWKLTRLRGSAVFLNKTAQDAARELLNSQRFFKFDHEFRLTRDYPAPEFAMQYGESLYDYVLFRMEEQGAYYYFAPDGDRVIFADSPQSHKGPAAKLAYSPASGLDYPRREEVLQSFTLSRTPLPRQVVVRCYDWKDPNRVIVGQAEVSAGGMGDVYLAGENAESQAEADRLAKIRAEELACRGRIFTGSSSVPVLRPGVVFSLEGHYSASFNRDYMVTEIRHEGAQEAYITLGLGIPMQGAPDHYFYHNSFTCIPSDVPYRPERTAPRAKISGVIRAFVDGSANRRAEMDEYGRYKLIFPFDLSGRKGGNASCWIRMAGPQAGRDSGMAFPLLPGTEVVVSFIDGNPDRPVITGSLANGETGSISGRGNANISGIRTAGGNQITINDTDNKQGISLATAAGLGYTINSGSLGNSTEVTDLGLKAGSVGALEFASAFKEVATGFQIRQAATAENKWYAWVAAAAAALGGAGGKVVNSLAEQAASKGDNDTAEGLKWGATASTLVTTLGALLKTSCVSYKRGKGTVYGASLSAEEKSAVSMLTTMPSTGRLLGTACAWFGPRLASQTADVVEEIRQIKQNSGDAPKTAYNDKENEAIKAIQRDDNKNYVPEESRKEGFFSKEKDDYQRNKNVAKALGDLIEAKRKKGEDVSELAALKKELETAWARWKSPDSKDYSRYAKNKAIRDLVTTSVTGLVPEITALLVLIAGWRKMTNLGGISLDSKDNNVIIRAKEPVSLHSETGILLDAKSTYDDAANWGVPPNLKPLPGQLDRGHQSIDDVWPDGTDVERPAAAGKYVVVNAGTGDFGLFAANAQTVTTGQWVSLSPTHILKSDAGAAPQAELRIKEDGNGTIEAKVIENNGTILVKQGGGDGRRLHLSQDGCLLADGANVQLKLTDAQADLKASGSGLTLKQNEGEFKGGNASVTCKNNKITLDPSGAGSAEVCGITFQRANLKADGVMQLQGNMIKIG